MLDRSPAADTHVHAGGVVGARESARNSANDIARQAMFEAASRVLQYHAAALNHWQSLARKAHESTASHVS